MEKKKRTSPEKSIESSDPINHPKHYKPGEIEVIDAIDDWDLDFYLGNVVKYIVRHRRKYGLQDLKKAQWYLNRYIKYLEEDQPNESAPDREGSGSDPKRT